MPDILRCDSALIETLKSNPDYDYHRELVGQQESLWEMLKAWFDAWLRSLWHDQTAMGLLDTILVVVGVVAVGLIAWFLYKYRPELFRRNRQTIKEEDDEEETIYGIDFDREISRAAESGNYRQAVRYVYLKTLRRLSDTGKIDWQPSKTPSQYLREVPSEAFRTLTSHFLRVRYGNFTATRPLFEEMQRLSQEGGWG